MEHKQWMLDYLTDLAAAAGVRTPENVGKTLMLLHEGIAVSIPTGCPPDAIHQARTTAAELITALQTR